MAEDPEVREALAAAGFPTPAFDAYEVAEIRFTGALVSARA